MLLVLGVLLLQARLLAPCMLLKTTGPFTAALKYTIPTCESFDACAKACYNDLDCIYVAYGNGSQSPKDTSCNIYMRGGVVFPAHPKVYGMNRTGEDTSSAMCSSVVQCAAKQNYTKVNATDKLTIEEQQCPYNASIVTINVYKEPTYGFHVYAMNGTDPIPGYNKICSMEFLGMELTDCNSVPVYTRGEGDYIRFFFGNDSYEKTGYSKTNMSVLPQPCIYNGTLQCYSSVKIREYKRSQYDDFVYWSSVPPGYPYDPYVETEVTQDFWIVSGGCY